MTETNPVLSDFGVVYDDAHIEIPESITYEEWENLGLALAKMHQSSPWWIGDWYNSGALAYGEKAASAKAIADAVDPDGRKLNPRTVQEYAYLANKFPQQERHASLTIKHHEAVRAVKDVDERHALLDRAESDGLTVQQLKRLKSTGSPDKPESAPDEEGEGEGKEAPKVSRKEQQQAKQILELRRELKAAKEELRVAKDERAYFQKEKRRIAGQKISDRNVSEFLTYLSETIPQQWALVAAKAPERFKPIIDVVGVPES